MKIAKLMRTQIELCKMVGNSLSQTLVIYAHYNKKVVQRIYKQCKPLNHKRNGVIG